MRLAFASPLPPDSPRPPLKQRATSLLLAVAVTILLIIGLLTLNGTMPQRPRFKGGPVVLDLKPDAERADSTPKPAQAKPEPAPERPAPPPKAIPVPEIPPPPMPTRSYYIHLTKEDNDAADISKHLRVPMRDASSSVSGAGAQQASTAGDSQPVGTAPNGEPLYNADWYRRPTDAELGTYLPPHMPARGWGLVACRTIANHHVDDCVELGSSPPGSHLAGAVRQAAWQFLVRAPRLGGRELVGTWVRIRIDYTQKSKNDTAMPDDAPASGD